MIYCMGCPKELATDVEFCDECQREEINRQIDETAEELKAYARKSPHKPHQHHATGRLGESISPSVSR